MGAIVQIGATAALGCHSDRINRCNGAANQIRATIRRNYREFDMKYTSGDTMKWCRHFYIVYTIVSEKCAKF
jgi:hypothetical protein